LSKTAESSGKTIERVEEFVLNPIGRIIQALAYFGREDVDYSSALAQPQAAVGCLLDPMQALRTE
jgi:hypothetical protein